jgi:hypothetical protein
MRVLHKVGLSLLAAKAVGPASVRRIDSAIRLYVLMVGRAPGTLIAKFASHGISRGANPSTSASASDDLATLDIAQFLAEKTCEIGSHTPPVAEGLINLFQHNWFQPLRRAFFIGG